MTIIDRADAINNLLKSFKTDGISHHPKRGLDKVLLFQDLIGRATMPELCEIEAAFTEEQRRTLVWACFTCLGYDSAMNVFKDTVGRRKIVQWYEAEAKQLREDQEACERRMHEATVTARDANLTLAAAERLCEEAHATALRKIQDTEGAVLVVLGAKDREIQILKDEIETLIHEGERSMAERSLLRQENNDLQAVRRVMNDMVNKSMGVQPVRVEVIAAARGNPPVIRDGEGPHDETETGRVERAPRAPGLPESLPTRTP